MAPETAGASMTQDHAGSVLSRLLVFHPEVVDIRILGQTDMPGGVICYSLGVILPGGRELYIDVEDAPSVTGRPAPDVPTRRASSAPKPVPTGPVRKNT